MICIRPVHARYLIFWGLLLTLGVERMSSSQAAAQVSCSLEKEDRAASLLPDARGSWLALLAHQEAFVSCDDGALAEGYSDAVAQLFVQKWDQLGVFVDLAKKHPDFQRWAVRHIDATVSDDDLNKIIANAATCIDDVAVANICKSIRRAAENALVESTQMRQ
ncbi:hypothetical protein HX882_32130 [Pseudomonas gingeri]|uniref:Uncharacterized protein n=1 Tax=Pseudomonas gingeri TaxID=117681 RepID=A0A7Y7XIJ0_9PSED|nr:hypothetical protein [Pseudomonas gingeri]NWC00530.1 hypothetical protein [Pseudomonas gingeri]